MSDPHPGAAAMEFARQHKRAMAFQYQAANDYVEARCLILNSFFGGLSHGAMAAEKYLKALILFADATVNVRQLSHRLTVLLAHPSLQQTSLDVQGFAATSSRFEVHYRSRYPDNPEHLISKSTEELEQLDELCIAVSEALPLPTYLQARTGIYSMINIGRDAKGRGGVYSPEYWLTSRNPRLTPIVERLQQQAFASVSPKPAVY